MDLAEWMDKVEVIIAIIAGIPSVGAVLISLVGRAGRAWNIARHAWKSIKDGKVDDLEVATSFWMLTSVLIGFWPSANGKVLAYMPDHQREILKKQGFIKQDK